MKYYVLFAKQTGGHITPVLGDRGIITIDGRLRRESAYEIAANECIKRGFTTYKMVKRDHLRDVPDYENIRYLDRA